MLAFENESETLYRAYVICEYCEESSDGGPFRNTQAAAQTGACDKAKEDGWEVGGNSAACPDCTSYSGQHETGDTTGDSMRESYVSAWEEKRRW
jgi:hypothetical protein